MRPNGIWALVEWSFASSADFLAQPRGMPIPAKRRAWKGRSTNSPGNPMGRVCWAWMYSTQIFVTPDRPRPFEALQVTDGYPVLG